MSSRVHAQALLRRLTGRPDATFRDGQWEAIEQLVDHHGRALVVQRTGWGKSAVYFLATRLLRDRGGGPTVLISPLLALMRNQLKMVQHLGLTAHRIDSTNPSDWPNITAAIEARSVDLLLISPERLNNPAFRRDVVPHLVDGLGLLVIDEAHCISDWGHDFRPDYRRIRRVMEMLPGNVPVLCTTATANNRVVGDIVEQLGDLTVVRGHLDRPTLQLATVELPGQAQRLAWLATILPELEGSGIVYCLTVDDTRRVADWLQNHGIAAQAYSGQTEHDRRVACEESLLRNEVKVVVATSALGMGFDKPDLAFVVHYQSPGSPVAYYQQVGRAGRAIDSAVAVLLCGQEDRRIQDHFIETAFPPQAAAEAVVGLLERVAEPISLAEIEQNVNVRRSRLETMLKVLEVEGAVERIAGGWRRTLSRWTYDIQRAERVTALRREEQEAMRDYANTTGCRMAFLLQALDDKLDEACARCDNCTGHSWTRALPAALVAEAQRFLERGASEIEPRCRWIAVGLLAGTIIPANRRLMPGRALSRYGDGGWGDVVRRCKYAGLPVPHELIAAAVSCIREWDPDPAPSWLAFVPSCSSHELVIDVARALAEALGLDLSDVVRQIRPSRPQKEMENSAQQLRNVQGRFTIAGPVPSGPGLLVDDIVDSRWTLTMVGVALREAGSGPVHPFALAKAVGR